MLIRASTNNQNTAPKKHTMNSETLKTSDNVEPPVQDLIVTQTRNCFEKFEDVLAQHVTTLGNQISKNVIDAMNTSDNPRIDKEEGTKKRSHSSRAKASEEDEEEHSRCNCRKLRNNSCRDKSQIQEKRKVRETNSSESSEDDQISC